MDRLYLEKFVSIDDFKYFSKLVFNEEVMNMNLGRVFTIEESQMYFKGLLKSLDRHEKCGNFKVFERGTNAFIGVCALSINKDFSEAEVEYMLMPEYWGKGYGSEILGELLNIADSIPDIRKLVGITKPNNIISKRILCKYGFKSVEVFKVDDGTMAERLEKNMH